MSVATVERPHTRLTWAGLEHTRPANGSCSSNSTSSSSSVMPCSTSSSGKSSSDPTPLREVTSGAASWTSGTFSFPPCSSRTIRSLPIPLKTNATLPVASASTSRSIHPMPGFDELAELVMAAGRPAVSATLSQTSASSASSSKSRRVRFNSEHATPLPPAATTALSKPLTAPLWTKQDYDDGRVTFIFGRLKPARVRYSAPPPQSLDPDAATTTIFTRHPSPSPVLDCHALPPASQQPVESRLAS